jgi:CBS domain-containing protein
MNASELMSHPVVTCPVDSDLRTAARLLWEYDVGALALTDRDGRLAGIVTDRDICMAICTRDAPLEDIDVRTTMSKDALVCHGTDSLDAVEALMRAGHVYRIPVVDDDHRPVGIVSITDLARLAERDQQPLLDREVVATLARICEPRTGIRHAPMRPLIPVPQAPSASGTR